MNEIGNRLYQRRKELGLTLEEVGNAVGVGKSTVRRWENGMIKNMGRDKIAALAKVLKISPVELVPGDTQQPQGLSADDQECLEALHQDPQLRMLFDRARRMSREDREKMLQISGIIKGELYGDD